MELPEWIELNKRRNKTTSQRRFKSNRKRLKIDLNKISSYKNCKISADDKRRPSAVIGYLGGILISIPIVIIVLSDVCISCQKSKK